MMVANKRNDAVDIELSEPDLTTTDGNLPPSKDQTAEELFEAFYSGVTLHGFRFLFEGPLTRRVVWLFVTTSVFAFSIYLFIGLVLDFHQGKTITLTEKNFLEGEIVFPTVTVCPNNGFSKNKIIINKPINISATTDLSYELHYFEWLGSSYEKEILEDLEKRGVEGFMDYARLYRIDMNDMFNSEALVKNIATCSFKRKFCGDSLFETTRVVTHDFNVCVSYNAFDRSGTRKKVTLDIKNDQTDENLKMWFDLKQSDGTNSHSSGAVAFINHFGDDNRLLPLFKNPIQLKTGEITFLRLVTNERHNLPSRSDSSCGKKSLPYIDPQRAYTKGLCMIDCLLSKAIKECGCITRDFENVVREGLSICSVSKISCFYGKTYGETRHGELYKTCYDSCPLECVQHRYQITTSSARINKDIIGEDLRKEDPFFQNKTAEQTRQYFQDNIVGLDVAFTDNTIVVDKETPVVAWQSLLASIGGGIGLGLGFSFITAFEFIFYFYDLIKLRLTKNKNSVNSTEKY